MHGGAGGRGRAREKVQGSHYRWPLIFLLACFTQSAEGGGEARLGQWDNGLWLSFLQGGARELMKRFAALKSGAVEEFFQA